MGEPLPTWLFPDGGLTALDLDHLPGLPEHTELIDGGLFFMSPQRVFHLLVTELLGSALRTACPEGLLIRKHMSVILSEANRVEPDVLIVRAEAESGPDTTWYPAAAVDLVVEVVSPESQVRDRDRKPQLYARAGIRHFWRVEESNGAPVVYVYELQPGSDAYTVSGIHHDRLTLAVPFPVDVSLDLAGL